jgi:hypothetical protein
VGGGGGGWLESKHSDQLWLSFSLALAKPNKKTLKREGAIKTKIVLEIMSQPKSSWE